MGNIFDDLNPEQAAAVKCTEGPLLILAGAGSGKTRVITYRIAHLLQNKDNPCPPWRILAMTFTNKAAAQMRERVNKLAGPASLSVWISTYHSFCARLLRLEAEHIGLSKDFTIYDDTDSKKITEICLKELNFDVEKFKPSVICEMISSAKDKLLDPESYGVHAMTTPESIKKIAADVYELYQKKLKESNAVDFGDLLRYSVDLFKNSNTVLEKYQERFKYIMIDEYQDTNYAQYILTKLLAGKYKNICVVGDDDQAIYSWRGADIRNIMEFERDYPKTTVVYLEQNYRSTKSILDLAGKLIHNNHHRKPKKLWTNLPQGDSVVYTEFPNEFDEARAVADKIRAFIENEGCSLSEFAVFYRTNAQSRIFEETFTRFGIPFIVVGSQRFYERAEVKDILGYLKLINNPLDDLSFRRVINTPARGIGRATVLSIEKNAVEKNLSLYESAKDMHTGGLLKKAERFVKLIDSMIAEKNNMDASEISRIIIEETGYIRILEEQNNIESRSRIENIQELVSAIVDFEASADDKKLASFLENIALISDVDVWDDNKEFVTLITLHLAKGLEFPCVFLTGLEEGLFPVGSSAYTMDSLEEERRLCYVGITRAKKYLYMSGAAQRRIYGQIRWSIPSRFVKEIGLKPEPEVHREIFKGDSLIEASVEHDVPAGPGAASHFYKGLRVKHRDFGEGKVLEVSGSGDDLKVIVQFDAGFWKKLLVKYANLERL
ncbi:MAG: UvrD-helicase domain-containing protein [Elusimicrobia bacterium]|nr:UvrD-helicase domain-containing protein [Elusimicrobiota bacterium]